MLTRSIDFRGSIVANLPQGRIETRDQRRLVALPADWLATLVSKTPANSVTGLGLALGEALLTDVYSVLELDEEHTTEQVAYALSAALAARGLGTVSFERWGSALTLIWHHSPANTEAWSELAAAIAVGLVRKLTGLDVAAVPVGHTGDELRILFASPTVCEQVRDRTRQGAGFHQILAHLEPSPATGKPEEQ